MALSIVATPIGNLSDMTPRGLVALKAADTILCEDTRRTRKLMSAAGISKPLERLDAYASDDKIQKIVERLKQGERIALVSDAGTPCVSDPGAKLVAMARAAGVEVLPLPGVSAVTALLSVAGFVEQEFIFGGFFPRRSKERRAVLDDARKCKLAQVVVWFESPERITEALTEVAACGAARAVVAAKEISKIHERFFAGRASEVAAKVKAEIDTEGPRGEWCFVVHFAKEPLDEGLGLSESSKSSDWVKALNCLLDSQVSARDAARRVSQYFGVPKRSVYQMALRLSQKNNT